MIKLYENIKTLRKQNEWSQDELAKKMGYTDRSMIAKIEAGSVDLAESKILAFAKIFGVKPCDLMGWDGSAPAAVDGDSLRKDEAELLDLYGRANSLGRKEIRRYAEYICSRDEYKKGSSEESSDAC